MTHEELLLFGERLRNRRCALGFTQEYIAGEADISLRFYQMIERGEKTFSLETLIRLSKALSISIDYLLFGTLSNSPGSPLADTLNKLSIEQREDALTILQLFSKACNS